MDLRLFLRVLWRFRALVFIGFMLAVGLAVVSFYRVSFDGGKPEFRYREKEEWASYARLLVTQPGFDWGHSVVDLDRERLSEGDVARLDLQQAVETRLSNLAIFYSRLIDSKDERLVDSDALRRIILRGGPLRGEIEAAPLPAVEGGESVLPIISIAGISDTASMSLALTQRTDSALREYIAAEQRARNVPPSERIQLEPLQSAGGTRLLAGRSKTLPIVVFLTVMVAVIGLAFILENLRPRVRSVPSPESAFGPSASLTRRSAG
jgi:hypothetical protein